MSEFDAHDISSSTPIKDMTTPLVMKLTQANSSVDDLLRAIDKNISSTSLNAYDEDSTNNNVSTSFNASDDNPIKPLNLKPLVVNPPTDNSLSESNENIMENIPRAPSFDELEFNTRLNRESSISRISGPRQLANSSLSRTFSNKMGRSSSFRSSAPTTRDNSPSKKSVCFEASPPKIVEYDEFSPDDSETSLENQPEATLESTWNGKLKPSEHPLPPPPPKHQVFTPSPQKDTTLGSSDEDSQDFNLTKEDLQNYSITLEQRLDLILDSDDVSKRVQEDETNRGSGSPLRSISQDEENLILRIKNKQQLVEDDYLKDAAELFEQDLRNSDRSSNVIRLDPILRRSGSNNSLRDEERGLTTTVIATTKAPIVLEDGMKNIDVEKLPHNEDLISVSESTTDSFASATDIFESEPIEYPIKTESGSSNSISTLKDEVIPVSPSKAISQKQSNGHKKKLSLSESINSFISSFGSKLGSPVKQEPVPGPETVPGAFGSTTIPGSIPDPVEAADAIDPESSAPQTLPPSVPTEQTTLDTRESIPVQSDVQVPQESITAKVGEADNDDVVSLQSSINVDVSQHTNGSSPVEHQSLLEHSSPVAELHSSLIQVEDLLLDGLLHDSDLVDASGFADEFKETMLYNTSDRMNEDYRSLPVVEGLPSTNLLNELADEENVESYNETDPEFTAEKITATIPEPAAFVKQEDLTVDFGAIPEDADTDDLKSQDDPQALTDSAVPSLEESNNQSKSTAVQTGSIGVEIAVQTDDLDFGEDFTHLGSALDQSGEFDSKPEQTRAVGALPSFNSTLFHDKVPEDAAPASTPPTSYIDIWNSQPKSASPKPQYGFGSIIGSRTVTPPEDILRRLSTRRSKNERREKITLDYTQLKEEDRGERKRLSFMKDDSLIATSFSQSSFIKVESRDTSTNIDLSRHQDGYTDTSNLLADSSHIGLPDLTDTSDFANAFHEWDLSQSKDVADRSIRQDQLKLAQNNPNEIKAIWGSNETIPVAADDKSLTSSIEIGKIRNMISTVDNGEMAHVKSSTALGAVVVTKQEDPGVEVEYDSPHNTSDYKPLHGSLDSSIASPLPAPEPVYSMVVKSVKPLPSSPVAPIEPAKERLISGTSDGTGLDISDEFKKDMNARISSGTSGDILDDDDLSKPTVPEVDNLGYMKTRVRKDDIVLPSENQQGPRVRTPLAALGSSDINQLNGVQSRKPSINTQRVASQKSENYHTGTDITLSKRDSRMSMFQHDATSTIDKGRLYIHINSLSGIVLDHIKNHNASFKLYIDNGNHVISTPSMTLANSVSVDKEFEVAVEEDLTDLHFTFKIAYNRPENELVEVAERIPLNNNRLGRLIGVKPKYKIQKSFITRKVVHDPWDHKFANDGSFGKNKISFFVKDNEITGKTQNYSIELFNEWETQMQNGKEFKRPPHMIAKMDVTMLFIPRTSQLETLPPSINVAKTVSAHLVEQSNARYEGFLFQEGGDCELWKRRYFRIEGTKMIAHHEVTKKPRAQINLLKVVDVIHNGQKKIKGQRSFTDEILMNDGFKLKFKNGEIITFNAETEELKSEWIEILEKVVGFNKLHQPWVRTMARNQQTLPVQ